MLRPLFLFLALLCVSMMAAQHAELPRIAFDYRQQPLREVLRDLEHRYHLRFAYSSDLVPLNYKLTARTPAVPARQALDLLFEDEPIRYAIIGQQIVLRYDPEAVRPKDLMTQQLPPRREEPTQRPRETPPPAQTVPSREPRQLPGGDRIMMASTDIEALLGDYEPQLPPPPPSPDERYHRLAQVSLLPQWGSNEEASARTTNNFSLNVFAGVSGGVEGLEVGGFYNGVKGNVTGVQVPGLVNNVDGHVTGTQVSGLLNRTKKTTFGAQVAGLLNLSGGDLTGAQIGGLMNISSGNTSGLQVSGLGNISKGSVRTQISGLFNIAGDVRNLQASPLLNVGRRVKGTQIGLINIADTLTGAPIGLINIVRRGYNRLEIGATEALYVNLQGKLGTHRLYNIFHVGARWDQLNETQAGQTTSGTFMSWGLGYGLGAAPRLGRRSVLNTEVLALHVNEVESWTSTLNLLTQLRMTLEMKAGRGVSFFAGPVLNAQWSKLRDPESGAFTSRLAPWAFYEETRGDTHFRAWAGFTAGVRFGR